MVNSHKRETTARPTWTAKKVAGPVASLATTAVVGVGIFFSGASSTLAVDETGPGSTLLADLGFSDLGEASARESVSRSSVARPVAQKVSGKVTLRKLSVSEQTLAPEATAKALENASKQMFTTEELNIWSEPGEKGAKLGTLDAGAKVTVTGRSLFGRDEIVFEKKSRWVTRGYLSTDKPEKEATLGGACTNGTSTSGGANVQAVHNAVCAAFPEITTYGGTRGGGGDHGVGRAVDIMVSGERGWEVANFVRANASTLGVSYVIYSQTIWSVERGGESWRGMSDRGSTTANHYDHVHVSVF